MPDKAKKTGGGNYFQSSPNKKPHQAAESQDKDVSSDSGLTVIKTEDSGSDENLFDEKEIDITAAEAALSGLSLSQEKDSGEDDNKSIDISLPLNIDVNDDDSDHGSDEVSENLPENLGDLFVGKIENEDVQPEESNNIVIPDIEDIKVPEIQEGDNNATDEKITDKSNEKDDGTGYEIKSGEPLDISSELDSLLYSADMFLSADAIDTADTAPDENVPEIESAEKTEDTTAASSKESEIADQSEIPVIAAASAEAVKKEEVVSENSGDPAAAAPAVNTAVKTENSPTKKTKTPYSEPKKDQRKIAPVIGITAAALILGVLALNGTNYIYRHMPFGLNTHLRAEGRSFSSSAVNSGMSDMNGEVSFKYSVEGASLKSRTSNKITVGEFIRSISGELKHESTDGEKWEYASNYPNSTVIEDGMEVIIDLVSSKTITSTDVLNYSTEVIGTEALPKGERIVLRSGINGLVRRVYSQKFVNGQMISNDISEEEVLAAPQSEVVYEGVGGTFTSPTTGKVYEYLYYIDVEATAYGVDTGYGGDSPWAYSGKLIEIGDIAVDPEVIPLGTKCYITCDEYDIGEVSAEDIGGAIKGNRIDIYMGNDLQRQLQFGRRQMRVYILKLPEE